MPRLPENSRTATFRQAATIHLPVLAAIYFWLGTDLAEIGFQESGESEKNWLAAASFLFLSAACILPIRTDFLGSFPYEVLRDNWIVNPPEKGTEEYFLSVAQGWAFYLPAKRIGRNLLDYEW